MLQGASFGQVPIHAGKWVTLTWCVARMKHLPVYGHLQKKAPCKCRMCQDFMAFLIVYRGNMFNAQPVVKYLDGLGCLRHAPWSSGVLEGMALLKVRNASHNGPLFLLLPRPFLAGEVPRREDGHFARQGGCGWARIEGFGIGCEVEWHGPFLCQCVLWPGSCDMSHAVLFMDCLQAMYFIGVMLVVAFGFYIWNAVMMVSFDAPKGVIALKVSLAMHLGSTEAEPGLWGTSPASKSLALRSPFHLHSKPLLAIHTSFLLFDSQCNSFFSTNYLQLP